MQHKQRGILLDVTRLIARSWTGRHATGIDRVCHAYLRQFRDRSLAVVQHRGIVRVLGPRRSDALFDMLLAPSPGFRARFTAWAPAALLGPRQPDDIRGLTYINVSHTDFDLPQHFEWVRRNALQSVYFIHDLIPILHPEMSRPQAVDRHTGRVRGALVHGDQIIAGSNAVAADIRDYAAQSALPTPPITISHIAGEQFAPTAPLAPPIAPSPTAPYFLCVGTIEPRKNHRLLFDVWCKLASQLGAATPRLIIVGQTGPMTGDIASQAAAHSHIEMRPSCTDQELAALMSNCTGLLMPSIAEGYGLPVVEALTLGTPVIASDLTVFREIGQGAAQLIAPTDVGAWASAIVNLAEASSSLSAAERKRRAERFIQPTWEAHFDPIERAIAASSSRSTLKSDAACESSLAA